MFRTNRGQSLAEVGIILGLIGVVVIVGLLFLGGQVTSTLHTVSTPV